MSSEPLAAEYAFRTLKSEICAGHRLPGALLIERALAQDYSMSVSPIREAAQRLLGERLVERVAGGGYRVSPVTAVSLRDLYAWHGQIIRLAVRQGHSDRMAAPFALPDIPDAQWTGTVIAQATAELFESLAGQSGNPEYLQAVRSAGDRLHIARLGEVGIFSNVREELRSLARLTGGRDLTKMIQAYHRRRVRHVDRLAIMASAGLARQ